MLIISQFMKQISHFPTTQTHKWMWELYFILFINMIPSESEIIQMTGSLPVFVQQAAAAKSIRYVTIIHYNYNMVFFIKWCLKNYIMFENNLY